MDLVAARLRRCALGCLCAPCVLVVPPPNSHPDLLICVGVFGVAKGLATDAVWVLVNGAPHLSRLFPERLLLPLPENSECGCVCTSFCEVSRLKWEVSNNAT